MSNAQFWKDRVSQYPNRRKITNLSTGEITTVKIDRDEGTIDEEGTVFNAENMNKIVDLIYPIGAIYMSVNSISPQTLFGGSWEQIQDKFLLASGSTYSAGSTGGASSHTHTTQNHTLTIEEIPSHSHNFNSAADESSTSLWSYTATYRTASKGQTDTTGGGQPHNHGDTGQASNLPPYLSVYVWKRTS
ncbi:hypothetical protein M9Y10_013515 [Tritrichomonas musculus]|uniref:Baseplate structural protein Gp10 C-terminal domain-containing protein n=1 Tax=Tritrichomonas musculus TaxID=1915356 RepID=A0ABR2GQ12_9EUKA